MCGSGTNVGTHDAPIRCVEYCPDVNVVITGSWDSTVKLWDPRTPCSAGTFPQPDKVRLLCCSFLEQFCPTIPRITASSKHCINFITITIYRWHLLAKFSKSHACYSLIWHLNAFSLPPLFLIWKKCQASFVINTNRFGNSVEVFICYGLCIRICYWLCNGTFNMFTPFWNLGKRNGND